MNNFFPFAEYDFHFMCAKSHMIAPYRETPHLLLSHLTFDGDTVLHPRSHKCFWVIEGPPGTRILLKFLMMNLGGGESAQLYLYDDWPNSEKVLTSVRKINVQLFVVKYVLISGICIY